LCNSTSHRRGLLAIQESEASSQIFLFLLDKNKSPQTRLQRAKAFANIVNAFSYLKYNIYFTSKIFRLNYFKAKSASKIVRSFFLFFPNLLKTCRLVRPTYHRLTQISASFIKFLPQTGSRPQDRCSSYILNILASFFTAVSVSLPLPFDLAPPQEAVTFPWGWMYWHSSAQPDVLREVLFPPCYLTKREKRYCFGLSFPFTGSSRAFQLVS